MRDLYDVVVIGGGINGCGCAADAALRGLSVLLCEKDDLAKHTSSKSTKLIHGGLRYLEQYNFSMVRKALIERQRLFELAPYLVRELQLVIPYQQHMRPAWILRAGLFIYDNLTRYNQLPHSHQVNRKHNPSLFNPLRPYLSKGFTYYDGTTNDTRLTIASALQAKQHGADILTQTKLVAAEANQHYWLLHLENAAGQIQVVQAKSIINACGPWVNPVNDLLGIHNYHQISLVKGSHILVPQLYEGPHAYFLQHEDERLIFVIPYQGYTMIGTTDVAFTGDLNQVQIEPEEIDYLCRLCNQYFEREVKASDIVDHWSGVRPLIADSQDKLSKLSRDYSYHFSSIPAPAVAIYGGKITTYRQLASEVIDQLKPVFHHLKPSITKSTPLPGSGYDGLSWAQFEEQWMNRYRWLTDSLRTRYLQTYGSLCLAFLTGKKQLADLGTDFGHGLYQAEVDYLCEQEWATSAEDILWRRTKLGLIFSTAEVAHLADYLAQKREV